MLWEGTAALEMVKDPPPSLHVDEVEEEAQEAVGVAKKARSVLGAVHEIVKRSINCAFRVEAVCVKVALYATLHPVILKHPKRETKVGGCCTRCFHVPNGDGVSCVEMLRVVDRSSRVDEDLKERTTRGIIARSLVTFVHRQRLFFLDVEERARRPCASDFTLHSKQAEDVPFIRSKG